jgi:hypothetical protein
VGLRITAKKINESMEEKEEITMHIEIGDHVLLSAQLKRDFPNNFSLSFSTRAKVCFSD